MIQQKRTTNALGPCTFNGVGQFAYVKFNIIFELDLFTAIGKLTFQAPTTSVTMGYFAWKLTKSDATTKKLVSTASN